MALSSTPKTPEPLPLMAAEELATHLLIVRLKKLQNHSADHLRDVVRGAVESIRRVDPHVRIRPSMHGSILGIRLTTRTVNVVRTLLEVNHPMVKLQPNSIIADDPTPAPSSPSSPSGKTPA